MATALNETRTCWDCVEGFCACGCQGKPGQCVKCNGVLCPDCFQEAMRERRGVCGTCFHPPPEDSDIEEYDESGYKPGPFGESFFIRRTGHRVRKNAGL